MISPKNMKIIQIDITNACIHRCSNCTRFCGHEKKPFFMNYETFVKAVESLEGFHGIIGIMGGEPTLHPEFERFVCYIKEHAYYPKKENLLLHPVKDFMDQIAAMEQQNIYIREEDGFKKECIEGFGLWTTMGDKYFDYYELIQDTFNYQAIDDHTQPMFHSPIMVRRKDLKISDERWKEIRDNCWIQTRWSATITPKGAFFCEIAGALDMLLDGPGGWPIEKDWWRREPEDFGEQLRWCEYCGIACNTFSRNANEEVDDISDWWSQKLKELESPKWKNNKVNVLNISEDGIIADESKRGVDAHRENAYADSYFSRFNNQWLNPKGLCGFVKIDFSNEFQVLKDHVASMLQIIDWLFVTTCDKLLYDRMKDEITGERVTVLESEYNSFGGCVNRVLPLVKRGHLILALKPDAILADACAEFLKGYVFNPGSILIQRVDADMSDIGSGVMAIFSPMAKSLRHATYPGIKHVSCIEDFVDLWPKEKQFEIAQESFTDRKYGIEPDKKYAFYGTGKTGDCLFELFEEKQIVFVCDSDIKKRGMDFHGMRIIDPDELLDNADEFDRIFVASRFYFEIKEDLVKRGYPEERIVTTLRTVFS